MSQTRNDAQNDDGRFYNLTGVLGRVQRKTSATGTPYVSTSFATTLRGRPTRLALTLFGKSIENVGGDKLVDGAQVSLRGSFGEGPKGGRTFTAVDVARARQAPAAAA